ncbi:MAG: DUF669 domain-containing protein [Methanothrix sp.]|nr:DUF669 domain-containing protein [Methanothrix sp.]
MQIDLDFSNVQEFEAIPAGNYPIVVEQVEMKQSQNSDYPYLNYTLTITDGEYANRKLFMISSLSPKALWRAKAVFQTLGVYQEKMDIQVDDDTNLVVFPELVGAVGIAVVGQETYEGRIQNRVQDIVPMDDGVANELAQSTPPPAVKTPATPATAVRKPIGGAAPTNGNRPAFRIK